MAQKKFALRVRKGSSWDEYFPNIRHDNIPPGLVSGNVVTESGNGQYIVNALAASDVVDNITSTAKNKPLSANMGKFLYEVSQGKTKAYVVDTESQLSSITDQAVGDVALIRQVDVPDRWWDGTTWQVLETRKIDLSNYYDKNDIDSLLSQKSDTTHKHQASDITSGTLAIERGGTGASNVAAARQNLGAASALEATAYLIGDYTAWYEHFDGSGNTYYTQDVYVSGITSSDRPIIDCVIHEDGIAALIKEKNWALVYKIETSYNYITVYAYQPTIFDLELQILCVRG